MNQFRIRIVSLGVFLAASGACLAGPVNVNTADAETLARELNGVGPSIAAAIVRDREEHGRFEAPDDLRRVNGVGPRIIEQNRDYILIDSAPASR